MPEIERHDHLERDEFVAISGIESALPGPVVGVNACPSRTIRSGIEPGGSAIFRNVTPSGTMRSGKPASTGAALRIDQGRQGRLANQATRTGRREGFGRPVRAERRRCRRQTAWAWRRVGIRAGSPAEPPSLARDSAVTSRIQRAGFPGPRPRSERRGQSPPARFPSNATVPASRIKGISPRPFQRPS